MRKVYIGGGVLGEIAALKDEYRCRQREEEVTYWKERQEGLQQDVAYLQQLEEAAEILARAHLIAAGYHKHKGEWRRQRERSAQATRRDEGEAWGDTSFGRPGKRRR
jgi:hypothetical protein